MELLIPKLGLFVWALLIFLLLVLIMAKFAWKPIMSAIHKREEEIQQSIDEAKRVREEMSSLKAENEKLLAEARAEREALLKQARDMAAQILAKAKEEASDDARRTVEKAREEIRAEKMAALTEVKNQVAVLSIEIAEKVLRQELTNVDVQKSLVDNLVKDLKLN
jgi:F-type H+-transporting ATPase subunit b